MIKAERGDDETPGEDTETPGVDDTDDDDEDNETPGVDGETPGVDEAETQEDEENEDDGNEQKKDDEETVTRAAGSTSLQKLSQKRYDNKSLHNQSRKEYDVFNIIEETESNEGVMMLQIDPGNTNTFNVVKATTDVEYKMMDEEYVYLTEDLGWKEGMKEEFEEEESKCDPKDATKLSEYLFLTEQMG